MSRCKTALFILFCVLLGVVTQYFLKLQHAPQKSTYHQEKVDLFRQLKLVPLDVIFVGDSITDNAEWHEFFPNIRVANRGIQGDTALGLEKRIANITQTKAKKVFLMIGINDLTRNHTVSNTLATLHRIITQLSDSHERVYIQSTLFISNEKLSTNHKVKELNIGLKKITLQFNNTTFIDLNKHLSSHNHLNAAYTFDGIHLNGEGYLKWQHNISHFVYE